ncbi:glycoside hydrolase family 97 catalytic domain-containing protein [Pelobium manganitolerans]|uniref:glycoside hydrolase family 97 protein n=1 Tax=Pelobium manganitolerans TaxID=1842495 RepID=UPI003FA35563
MNKINIVKNYLFAFLMLMSCALQAQVARVASPNKNLDVAIWLNNGAITYTVNYKGKAILENSPLGLTTNEADFTEGMNFISSNSSQLSKTYSQQKIKKSEVKYEANKLTCVFENPKKYKIGVVFQLSNNDIAFRYEIPAMGERMSCVIQKEATGYKFPNKTTTFLSGMMSPMTGFARTAPSYESDYQADRPLKSATRSGGGYVFPALFKIGEDGWALLSETGVNSQFCASHLSEYSDKGIYTIEYPDIRQNNGFGSSGAAISLPGLTPWRTITVGDKLDPIVETTVPFDVVEPLYEPSKDYQFGRSTWSWIVWQDNSMNYEDQVKYIDLAASLKYEYILIDALWDKNIGKERMATLINYAKSKGVGVFLWYNSNGAFNDAPQGPRNKMSTAIERKKEMSWLKDVGVKGLKVDFFGGDKQETMRLYEDILSDANDYGLMVVFHGATLPRGWERMYPNFVGSEAVVASEMLIFSQHVREIEAYNATMHPFIRNTVASMEFGGVLLNKYLTKSNTDRNKRLTTDVFQLATAILYQSPVQMFGLTPNNLTDVPAFEIDFMKQVPTTWDETVLIDGYPGKYVVLARRHGKQWYVAGANATKEAIKLKLQLPMLGGKTTALYNDDTHKAPFTESVKISKAGKINIEIQPSGGFVLVQKD